MSEAELPAMRPGQNFSAIRAFHPAAGMIPTLVIVAALWSVSSWGYYALVESLALENGYDDAPLLFTVYYLGWAMLAAFIFQGTLAGGLSRPVLAGHAVALLPVLISFAIFVAVVLPLLPDVSVYRAPADPPEFMFASAWYYLPKSADILFQQVILATLICLAARLGLSLRSISIGVALLFGGFHLTLAFDGFTAIYVARFTFAATLFGAIAPYLYLRARQGFRWAYGLHWSFYALDATITHLILAAPPWA